MEKCMMATSLAFLLCHPNSNTKCSNPCKPKKPFPNPKPNKPQEQQQKPTKRISTPRLMNHHKSNHFELVYNRLEPTKCPPIQALETILRRGWDSHSRLVINEVLKVNHEPRVVDKFDKYRELVKQKASKNAISIVNKRCRKKLMDDGFELLGFIGSKLACREPRLDRACRKRYCGVSRLLRIIGTSSLECLRPISVSESAWMAHERAVSKGSDGRKVVIVCRVIAGRVADQCSVKIGEDDCFDSVFVPISDLGENDELLVFNPSAILPCFVVLYDV